MISPAPLYLFRMFLLTSVSISIFDSSVDDHSIVCSSLSGELKRKKLKLGVICIKKMSNGCTASSLDIQPCCHPISLQYILFIFSWSTELNSYCSSLRDRYYIYIAAILLWAAVKVLDRRQRTKLGNIDARRPGSNRKLNPVWIVQHFILSEL